MSERPTKEVTIHVTSQDKMQVTAYVSDTPGLVVHKQVRWSPGKEEHKFTSKWQVTHESSGDALLTPARCLPRMKDALKFAGRLADIEDWANITSEKMSADDQLLQTVKGVYEGIMREQEEEEGGQVVIDEMYENRYYVERDRETRMYQVLDSKDGSVATDKDGNPCVYSHRGRAWKEAHRLNEKVG